MEYDGFDKIPSKVVWSHNGKPIDPTKWTISISQMRTQIKSDRLMSVDEGQYTCQVVDDELGISLESSGMAMKLKLTGPTIIFVHLLKMYRICKKYFCFSSPFDLTKDWF